MSEDGPKHGSRGASDKRRPNIDPAFVRELASLLEETGLSELEIEEDGIRVRVVRAATVASGAPPAAAPTAQSAEPARGTTVSSPMVGTAYLGPQPGAPAFVKIGDTVDEGQTLLIIEAMKTMNQVQANVSGRVTEIYVQDGQPVEFGEPLMLID